jgi:hypothetical protein
MAWEYRETKNDEIANAMTAIRILAIVVSWTWDLYGSIFFRRI